MWPAEETVGVMPNSRIARLVPGCARVARPFPFVRGWRSGQVEVACVHTGQRQRPRRGSSAATSPPMLPHEARGKCRDDTGSGGAAGYRHSLLAKSV